MRKSVFAQRSVSIEIPVMGIYHLPHVSSNLKSYNVSVNNGLGYLGGLGVKVNPINKWAIKTGIQILSRNLEAEYSSYYFRQLGSITVPITVSIEERGRLNMTGIYLMNYFETRAFLIGAGIEYSLFHSYKGDYSIRDLAFNTYSEYFDVPFTVMGDDFRNQLDVVFQIGGRGYLTKNFILQPIVAFNIPIRNYFKQGADVLVLLLPTYLRL